jgi:hypothetical protein
LSSQHSEIDQESVKGVSGEGVVVRCSDAAKNDIPHCHAAEVVGVHCPVKDTEHTGKGFRDGDPMKETGPQVEVARGFLRLLWVLGDANGGLFEAAGFGFGRQWEALESTF